jgi:hypothetical protein
VAKRGIALMGSSGYLWEADADVLMNSAVLGAPGANLPRTLPNGQPLPAIPLARRRGVFRWHRRTTAWKPLWLDSAMGDLSTEPATRNWGRLERFNETTAVTVLALRERTDSVLAAPELRGLRFTGRWILIAQGDASIFDCAELAAIPLDSGTIEIPRRAAPSAVTMIFGDREVPHEDWQWRDGRVTIVIDAEHAGQPFLGVLVRA